MTPHTTHQMLPLYRAAEAGTFVRTMTRPIRIASAIALGVAAGLILHSLRKKPPVVEGDPVADARTRQALFEELRPVKLSNCALERFGEAHDGGYLACGNLLGYVQSGYSYGINGYDGWGCSVSERLKIKMHQYDCFETKVPACPNGDTAFHAECIGPTTLDNSRLFDTLEHQIEKNGDAGKRIIMKIDVEGAEWDTFLTADPAVLDRIDQLIVEFHYTDDIRYIATTEETIAETRAVTLDEAKRFYTDF